MIQNFLLAPQASYSSSSDFAEWASRLERSIRVEAKSPRPSMRRLFKIVSSVSIPSNPIFVASAFGFSEVVTIILQRQGSLSPFTIKNVLNCNCAQIASQFNCDRIIRVLIQESRKHDLPEDYWNIAISDAAANLSFKALYTIIEGEGDFSVDKYDIENIVGLIQDRIGQDQVSKIFHEDYRSDAGGDFFEQLLGLRETLYATTLLPSLKKRSASSRALQDLLQTSNLLTKSAIAAETSSQIRSSDESSPLLVLGLSFLESAIFSIHEDLRGHQSEPKQKLWMKFYLLGTWMRSQNLQRCPELAYSLLLPGFTTDFELTWKDLDLANLYKEGISCLRLILQLKPRVSWPAVTMLLSQWDDDTVALLLAFKKVKVTNDVIRLAAGNLTWGEKIMKLLLEKELEELSDLESSLPMSPTDVDMPQDRHVGMEDGLANLESRQAPALLVDSNREYTTGLNVRLMSNKSPREVPQNQLIEHTYAQIPH